MSSPVTVSISALLGVVGGALFFYGLYLTTQMVGRSRHPGVLFLVSFFSRTALLVAGAWLVASQAEAAGVLAYLFGITLVRFIGVAAVRRSDATNS
jgi:F1F0 ATPase subunit 2